MSDPRQAQGSKPDESLVLLVDDEFDVLAVYTMLFEVNGFRVQTASNGLEALAAAALERPAIVVSDFMMPVMDGAQLCREWRASPALRSIPFILSSAGIMPREHAIAYDSFFKKPVHIDKLIGEIRRLLAAPPPTWRAP
jgi:CheY-like chemotaxis protein